MRFTLPSVVLAVAVAFTSGCAGPPTDDADQSASRGKQVNDATVISDQGPFQFSGITITPSYSGARIAGSVTNNTPKQWGFANFQITLFDANRQKIGSDILTFNDFSPGQTKTIGLLGYESLRLNKEGRIRSFDLKFVKGSYQAQYVISMRKPVAADDMVFSDGLIELRFAPSEKQLGFTVRNTGSGPVKIDWNSAAFVDIAGASHKVMHHGVKYNERGAMQAPTVIPPGAIVRDFVYPSDYVSFIYGVWNEQPMFPNAPLANEYKGHSFGVFLPIEIDGKVRNYNFVFRINDVIS
jgi:hypothetical protein